MNIREKIGTWKMCTFFPHEFHEKKRNEKKNFIHHTALACLFKSFCLHREKFGFCELNLIISMLKLLFLLMDFNRYFMALLPRTHDFSFKNLSFCVYVYSFCWFSCTIVIQDDKNICILSVFSGFLGFF